MAALVELAFWLLSLRSALNLGAATMILRWLGKGSIPKEAAVRTGTLCIVLPVYRETVSISDTIEYIEGCCQEYKDISVVIVGTARERDSHGNNPTLEMARVSTKALSRFTVVEDPRLTGRMAHQVNFAAEMLLEKYGIAVWLYIANIDSRFSSQGIGEIIYHINRGHEVIQQSALFLSTYKSLGFAGRAFALWQSRWTVSHELKRLILHNKVSYALAHCVGHGLCISGSKFREYGSLPEDTITEDLHFGYYLSAAGERIEPLMTLEIGDSPSSLKNNLKQKYVWAFGPLLYPQYYSEFLRKFPTKVFANPWRPPIIALQGAWSALAWLACTPMIVIAIIVAPGSVSAQCFLAIYFLEYFQCALFFRKRNLIGISDVMIVPILVGFAAIFHSLPAIKALIDHLAKRPISKHKTDHG